eukprot:333027-Pleurochrysis_carterae.AAC.3
MRTVGGVCADSTQKTESRTSRRAMIVNEIARVKCSRVGRASPSSSDENPSSSRGVDSFCHVWSKGGWGRWPAGG